jgi:hypothetical protein
VRGGREMAFLSIDVTPTIVLMLWRNGLLDTEYHSSASSVREE